MARYSNKRNSKPTDVVDINSNTQVVNIYNKKGKVLRIISLVLAIIMIFSGSLILYYYGILSSLNYKEYNNSGITELVDDDEANLSTLIQDGDLQSSSKVLNIMLFGEDYHTKNSNGRSDSMILLSINNVSKKIKLTSFQRDTYVYIPGYGYNKITSAFSYGGPALSIQTVEANFGIKIDRYAVVDFSSFKKIIDTLGGITMELSADEAAYVNWQMEINNQVPAENYPLPEVDGTYTLTGQQALWYARNRGYDDPKHPEEVYSGDDWDRTERQRKLLNTVFEDMKEASFTQLVSIVSQIGPLVTTNLKKEEITGLMARALTYLQYEFESYSMPQDGLWSYSKMGTEIYRRCGSCIIINDMEESRRQLSEFVYEGILNAEEETTTTE